MTETKMANRSAARTIGLDLETLCRDRVLFPSDRMLSASSSSVVGSRVNRNFSENMLDHCIRWASGRDAFEIENANWSQWPGDVLGHPDNDRSCLSNAFLRASFDCGVGEGCRLMRLRMGARLWASARYCSATTLSVGTGHVLARELNWSLSLTGLSGTGAVNGPQRPVKNGGRPGRSHDVAGGTYVHFPYSKG